MYMVSPGRRLPGQSREDDSWFGWGSIPLQPAAQLFDFAV
jgi:hypothetical protein